jgi:hypothetical protein
VSAQLLNKGYITRGGQIIDATLSGRPRRRRPTGYITRGGQIIDATLVPVPKQHVSRDEKDLIKKKAMPASWPPGQAAAEGSGRDLDQEARQEPLRLQALDQRG